MNKVQFKKLWQLLLPGKTYPVLKYWKSADRLFNIMERVAEGPIFWVQWHVHVFAIQHDLCMYKSYTVSLKRRGKRVKLSLFGARHGARVILASGSCPELWMAAMLLFNPPDLRRWSQVQQKEHVLHRVFYLSKRTCGLTLGWVRVRGCG